MNIIKRIILAAALFAGLSPTFAQVPPPIPALPDTQRIQTFSISASTCACSIGFAIFADGSDYQNWIKVYLNGAQVQYNDPAAGWKLTSPSGVIGSIAQPITDGVLTFNAAQTGTVQIVGARRPRRVTQFQEGKGVAARDLNEAFTDIVAQNRESWDLQGSQLHGTPGAVYGAVPSNCSNAGLGFDITGLNFVCTAGGLNGVSNYLTQVTAATAAALPNSPVYANGSSGSGATLTAGSFGALSIDGLALVNNNRVLINNQATLAQNGVYSVTQAGDGSHPYILTRVTDFDQSPEMIGGTGVFVTGGQTKQGGWVLVSAVPTVGTSPVQFFQFFAPGQTSAANIAALRLNFMAYPTIYVQGYTTVGDGGEGTFNLIASDTTSADNGGTIIVDAVGHRYYRSLIGGNNISVKWFGATGRGVVDDTVNIQKAINFARGYNVGALPSAGGLCVLFPTGNYVISSLDATKWNSGCLAGPGGSQAVIFNVTTQITPQPVLDLTSTAGFHASNLLFYAQVGSSPPAVRPSVGLLMAAGPGLSDSDLNIIDNVGFAGYYGTAACYVYSVPDVTMSAANCVNQATGGGTVGIYLGNINQYSIASPYTTIGTGTGVMGDFTWYGGAGGGGNYGGTYGAIQIIGCTQCRFSHGTFAGAAGGASSAAIFIAGQNDGLSFDSIQLNAANGSPTNLFYLSGAIVAGFTIINMDVAHGGYTTNFMGGTGTVTITGGAIVGLPVANLTGPYIGSFSHLP